MDFFDRQESARTRTRWLVVAFLAAVISIIICVYLVSLGAFWKAGFIRPLNGGWWNPQLFLITAGSTCAIVLAGSLFKMAQLRNGGSAVAEMLGGRLIPADTQDISERRILNVVEEMALASGMAPPPVYLLPEEDGINAFAAGYTPKDAVIGVTRGCVARLSRDEFQGVVAHEFSHILNGDMRLNLKLVGVLFGILCLAEIGRVLLQYSWGRSYRNDGRGEGKGINPVPLIGLGLLAVGSIGVFFGRIIQASVSRQREYLADASAVQFTRNPAGIAGALKKIGGFSEGSRVRDAHASETSHFFFGNPLGAGFASLFATHPPLTERIKAIDPSFTGALTSNSEIAELLEDEPVSNLSPMRRRRGDPANAQLSAVPASKCLKTVGSPDFNHLKASRDWQSTLTEELAASIRGSSGAISVIFALLLDRSETVSARQLLVVEKAFGPEIAEKVRVFHPEVYSLGETGRLPLANLCIPALREMGAGDYAIFRSVTRQLIECDEQVDLFEFALEKCLERSLAPFLEELPVVHPRYFSIIPVMNETVILISLVAKVGSVNPADADSAFLAGIKSLDLGNRAESMIRRMEPGLAEADSALKVLSLAGPAIKKRVLEAASHAAATDGILHPREGELLRAIADSLDCPIPPFLSDPQDQEDA